MIRLHLSCNSSGQCANGPRKGGPRAELLRDHGSALGVLVTLHCFCFCTSCWRLKSKFWLISNKVLTVPHEFFYINFISSCCLFPSPILSISSIFLFTFLLYPVRYEVLPVDVDARCPEKRECQVPELMSGSAGAQVWVTVLHHRTGFCHIQGSVFCLLGYSVSAEQRSEPEKTYRE